MRILRNVNLICPKSLKNSESGYFTCAMPGGCRIYIKAGFYVKCSIYDNFRVWNIRRIFNIFLNLSIEVYFFKDYYLRPQCKRQILVDWKKQKAFSQTWRNTFFLWSGCFWLNSSRKSFHLWILSFGNFD